MKNLFLSIGIALLSATAIAQTPTATTPPKTGKVVKTVTKAKPSKSKDADGIDGRMKGPNGEAVYIGEKGGRYYLNAAGNKVYVEYGNKNKKKISKVIKQLTK